MNYDNQHIDKKLQELENQSLPDLSKMDDHWHQMSSLLQPASPARRINMRRNGIILLFSGLVVIIISMYVWLKADNPTEESYFRNSKDMINHSMVPVDSTITISDSTGPKADTSYASESSAVVEGPVNAKLLLERFYEQIQKNPQSYQINNIRDTIIYGKEGTKLIIPANSFEAKGKVRVYITEFYSIDDMLANKLTTTCDGRQLITQGMIYLDARDENENMVDLKKGALLGLEMKKMDGQVPMELFYGNDYYRNDLTTVFDSINWTRTNQFFGGRSFNQFEAKRAMPNIQRNKMDTIFIDGDKSTGNYPYNYFLSDTVTAADLMARKFGDSIYAQRFGVVINRLGWINCDRFYSDPRPKVELFVDLGDDPGNYSTMLVFENIASIMPQSGGRDNMVRFSNLPEGEPVRIVIAGVRNKKTVTAVKSITVSKTVVGDFKFEPLTASGLSKRTKK